jgi:acyl-CoA thioesterase I
MTGRSPSYPNSRLAAGRPATLSSAPMNRRQFLVASTAAAGFALVGCKRRLSPELIKIEDYENRKGGWRAIKVACVGDSITFGAGVEDREKNNYPKQLGELLGTRFEVRNFGRSGATMSRTGDLPYAGTDEFKAASAWLPDVVILMLGTNDTKPQNWKGQKAFEQETRALLDAFHDLKSKPKFWACLPVPVYGDNWGITAQVLDDGVIPALMEVTNSKKIPVIDLNDTLTGHPEMFPDKIHPDAAGAALMARTIFQAIRP